MMSLALARTVGRWVGWVVVGGLVGAVWTTDASAQTRPRRGPPPPGGSRREPAAPGGQVAQPAAPSSATPSATPSAAPSASAPASAPASPSGSQATRGTRATPATPAAVAPVARAPAPTSAPTEAPASLPAFAPPALPIYGDGPPPPGYVLETQANSGLIIGGLVSFGTIYGASIIYGAANGFEQGLGALAVPILGPWLAVAGRDFSCDYALTEEAATACQEKTIDEAATLAVLSGLGIGQLIGATFTLVGVLDRDALWVRADAVGARFRVDSMSVAAGSGVRVFGEF